MSKINWNKVEETITNYNKKSRHHCVGMCTVSNRSHYANKDGFKVTHQGYDKNQVRIYKGHCAQTQFVKDELGLLTNKAPVKEGFHIPVHWVEVANLTVEALAEAKLRAEERAANLRYYGDVRKKLLSKAPSKLVRKFDRAVSHRRFLDAKDIARRYGVRL